MKRKDNLLKYRQDLKKVSLITAPAKKRDAVLQLAKAYEVSDKTIYRDLQKRHPGVAKLRKDAGKERSKATAKEVKIFAEMIKAGKSRVEAGRLLEKSAGKSIGTRKLTKISKKAAEKPDTVISSFGTPLKKVLMSHFEIDNVATDAAVKIKSGKYNILLTRQDCEDVVLILTNAYNRVNDPKLPFDRKQLLKSKIEHIIELLVAEAEQKMDVKMLNQISLIKQRMDVDVSDLSPGFHTVEKICKLLKPDITFDEIFALIEQFSE